MRATPVVTIQENQKKRLNDIVIRDAAFIGLRVIPPSRVNEFGRISLLFTLSTQKGESKSGTDYYVQKMYTLESTEEKRTFAASPYNVANFDEDMEDTFKELIAPMKGGSNSYASFFEFTKKDTDKGNFFHFEGIASSEDTKTDTIIGFDCTKRVWAIINQLMYWVLIGMPINTSIYTDERYEHIKITNVTGLIYEGSTGMIMEDNSKVELAHFVVHYQDGIHNEEYPMNVMCAADETKLHTKPMTNEEFEKRYLHTDTMSTYRFFISTSPEQYKGFAMLGVCPIINGFNIMIISEETAARVHWLDWDYYIYVHKEGEE